MESNPFPTNRYCKSVPFISPTNSFSLLKFRLSQLSKTAVDAGGGGDCVFGAVSPGGGLLPYMGYIGMCGPKGYGFSAVLVISRVSNLADSGHKQGIVFALKP